MSVLPIAVAALSAALLQTGTVTIGSILKAPAKFDQKQVSVKGSVQGFSARTAKSGHAYYLFKLKDGANELSVYASGTLPKNPSNGAKVVVTGIYAHERKVGDRVYKDEIECSTSLSKKFGVSIVGSK